MERSLNEHDIRTKTVVGEANVISNNVEEFEKREMPGETEQQRITSPNWNQRVTWSLSHSSQARTTGTEPATTTPAKSGGTTRSTS